FLIELPEEPMVLRDLSGMGFTDMRPRPGGTTWPERRPASRPAAPPREFRLITAAELAGSSTSGPGSGGPPTDPSAFQPGGAVIHPEYGLGRVVAIDGAGPLRRGRVAFATGPERTFVLAKSSLRPVLRSNPAGASHRPTGGQGST